MTPLYAVHYRKLDNLGDRLSSPCRYLDFGRPVEFIDFEHWENQGDAIIGGGGLLFDETEPRLLSAAGDKHKRVLWGVGTNYKDRTVLVHPCWLEAFDLVGLRDFGNKNLVPCASCLHPEFDRARPEPTRDAVIYEHPGQIPLSGFEKRSNRAADEEMGATLDFLASARVVITNSYHGGYWAALLGREVLCWKPTNNRHLFTPWTVWRCDEENWSEKLERALKSPFRIKKQNLNWLKWARELNMAFYAKVKELMA